MTRLSSTAGHACFKSFGRQSTLRCCCQLSLQQPEAVATAIAACLASNPRLLDGPNPLELQCLNTRQQPECCTLLHDVFNLASCDPLYSSLHSVCMEMLSMTWAAHARLAVWRPPGEDDQKPEAQ
jgi:hypothetical protein